MKRFFLFLPLIFCVACAGVSNSELQRAKAMPISRKAFAAQPFGFELTEKNIEENFGKKLHREHFLTADGQTEIFRYSKGQSVLMFSHAYNGPIVAMNGTIVHSKIALRNDIRVGMSRKAFFWQFSDWIYDSADMLTLYSPPTDCSFHFLFKNDKLISIRFVNRKNTMDKNSNKIFN